MYTDALKQMLISSPPPVLTLHLKRFQQVQNAILFTFMHIRHNKVLIHLFIVRLSSLKFAHFYIFFLMFISSRMDTAFVR